MTQITILKRTYSIPKQPTEIEALKGEIQQRSELVRLGQRPGRREQRVVGHMTSFLFFKGDPIIEEVELSPVQLDKTSFLFFKGDPIIEEVELSPVQLDEDERLRELEALVSNYDAMIGHLKSSQKAYERFFGELVQGVQQAVEAGTGRVREMERRRAALDGEAQSVGNEALAGRAREMEQRLMRSVRVMAQATLLLLRKIALCEAGLRALAGDHEAQQKVLAGLRQQIDLNRRLALLERDIAQFEKDVEAMARVSLQFESYMRDYFGPLQSLLEQVAEVDVRFHGAVQEIESLTRALLDDSPSGSALPGDDDHLLDALVRGALDRDKIGGLLARIEAHDDRLEAFDVELATEGNSIERALANVELLVEVRLEPLLALAPSPSSPPASNSTASSSASSGSLASSSSVPAVTSTSSVVIGAGRAWGAEFAVMEPGTFWMGSGDEYGKARNSEKPRHEVRLTHRFMVQKTPVTQRQWAALMGNNPSQCKGADRPMESVSWWDAVAFCNALSLRDGLEECYALKGVRGRPGEEGFQINEVVFKGLSHPGYRLPTEAEWECACRAGSQGARYGEIRRIAWYSANSGEQTHPVGELQANAWGLHDMLGNVWEWCWDGYDGEFYKASPERDPVNVPGGSNSGQDRVLRGGGFFLVASYVRAAFRYGYAPGDAYDGLGFRCSRSFH